MDSLQSRVPPGHAISSMIVPPVHYVNFVDVLSEHLPSTPCIPQSWGDTKDAEGLRPSARPIPVRHSRGSGNPERAWLSWISCQPPDPHSGEHRCPDTPEPSAETCLCTLHTATVRQFLTDNPQTPSLSFAVGIWGNPSPVRRPR